VRSGTPRDDGCRLRGAHQLRADAARSCAKIKAELEKTDFGCLLLFSSSNKRYATATAATSPESTTTGATPSSPATGEPAHHLRFGSEAAAARLNSPGSRSGVSGAHDHVRRAGARLGRAAELHEGPADGLDRHVSGKNKTIGIDLMDSQLLLACRAAIASATTGPDAAGAHGQDRRRDPVPAQRPPPPSTRPSTPWPAFIHAGVRENDIQAEAAPGAPHARANGSSTSRSPALAHPPASAT